MKRFISFTYIGLPSDDRKMEKYLYQGYEIKSSVKMKLGIHYILELK